MNVLIKEIHETVRECKPWVKFGVSPFGIYRNKKMIRMEVIHVVFRIMMIYMQMC